MADYILLQDGENAILSANVSVTAHGTIKIVRVGGDSTIVCALVSGNYGHYNYTGGDWNQIANQLYPNTNIYYSSNVGLSNITADLTIFPNIPAAVNAANDGQWDITVYYPINYTRTGCTLTAPVDAAPGSDVVITVNPAQGYAFRGSSGVDIRDSHGERVPFIVNGNQVAFTYPQPY